MFDGNFRNGVDRVTKPVGTSLVRLGVTADLLTGLGVLLSVACALSIAAGHLRIGLLLLVAAALPDLLDGPVAKASGTTSVRGAFFDSVADRVTDSLVMGGIAWHLMSTRHDRSAMLPLALIAVTQLISYERAKAEIFGFSAKGGLMERAERIVVLCVALAFHSFLIPILWVMLVLSALTAITRFLKVWKQATEASPMLLARRRETPPIMQTLFGAWTDSDERRRRKWRERASLARQSRRSVRNRQGE